MNEKKIIFNEFRKALESKGFTEFEGMASIALFHNPIRKITCRLNIFSGDMDFLDEYDRTGENGTAKIIQSYNLYYGKEATA